jgi:hypothetical protein
LASKKFPMSSRPRYSAAVTPLSAGEVGEPVHHHQPILKGGRGLLVLPDEVPELQVQGLVQGEEGQVGEAHEVLRVLVESVDHEHLAPPYPFQS